jgi:hypothetical protein
MLRTLKVFAGGSALTYAAGSIRQEMPIDGVINVITGDNQLSGNRMMLGWSGTDTLYLKLKNRVMRRSVTFTPCTGARAKCFTP